MWLLFGAASILFTLFHAYTALDRKRGTDVMAFAAFGCTALTLFFEYRMVGRWVAAEDWTALMDVVPSSSNMLTVYTLLLVLVNGILLIFGRKKTMRRH